MKILGYAILELAFLFFTIGFASLLEGKINKTSIVVGSSVVFGLELFFAMLSLAAYLLN